MLHLGHPTQGILLHLLCLRLAALPSASGFADGTAVGNVPLAAGTAACADPLLTITAGITAGDVPLTAGTSACAVALLANIKSAITSSCTSDGGCTALAICGGGGCGMIAAGALGGPVALHNNRFGKVLLGICTGDGVRGTATPPVPQSVLPGDHPLPGGGIFQGNVCLFAGGGSGFGFPPTSIDNGGGGGALGKGGSFATAVKNASDALTKSAAVAACRVLRNRSFINGDLL